MRDIAKLEAEARAFAIERHGSQRYGDQPYGTHLAAVRQVLADFDLEGSLTIAAWLHDALEDTATSRQEIEDRFGTKVEALVWAVTGIGKSRKERNANAYAKIRAFREAAELKLADRIANVEASRNDPARLAMYRKEWPGFFAALGSIGDERMWARLREALRGET